MSRLTRDGTVEPVSRDQILRHARGQGDINFPCSADHEQDWQPYPVDPYSALCDDHTYLINMRVLSMCFRSLFNEIVHKKVTYDFFFFFFSPRVITERDNYEWVLQFFSESCFHDPRIKQVFIMSKNRRSMNNVAHLTRYRIRSRSSICSQIPL